MKKPRENPWRKELHEIKRLVRMPDGTQKRKSFYGQTVAEAEAKYQEFLTPVLRPKVVEGTIAWYMINKVAPSKAHLAVATRKSIQEAYQKLHPYLGHLFAADVDFQTVCSALNQIKQTPICVNPTIKSKAFRYRPPSASLMNKCRTCALEINSVAHELTRGRVAKINPKRIPIFHDEPEEQVVLTPAQMRRMIALEPEHAALIAVYGFLGLRMSEGIALDETSLLPNGVLAVRMQADRHTGSVKPELKNRNSRRTILLPAPILEILRPLSFGGPILRNKDGKAHKHRALHALIGRIGRRHGIPNLSAHDFRHSLLTWLDENGAPRSTKLAIAGHSRGKVEDRYNHASDESKRDWILKAWEAGVVSAYDKPETETATEVAI